MISAKSLRVAWIGFFLALLIGACRQQDEGGEAEISEEERIAEKLGQTFDYSDMPDTLKAALIVRQWNGSHNVSYVDNLFGLYGTQVFFYGENRSRSECLRIKRDMLQKYPEYFQRIIGGIKVKRQSDGSFKCEFTKYVNIGKITAPVPAYLIVSKDSNGRFVIIAESDPQTDQRVQELKESEELIAQRFTASETEITGNFSGTAGMETMYIFPPEDLSCAECITSMFFSNELLPPLEVKGAKGANVLNEGDLDGDGADEFSVLTLGNPVDARMIVYTFKRGQWVPLVKFNVNKQMLLSDAEARKNAVRLAGQGYVYILEWKEDTLVEQKVNIWNY